ncbi:MAG: OmpA family protein [Deltaproteobacteria bacterium]|nr:OmpA family protein [Deltaproteobacteria bacterium]
MKQPVESNMKQPFVRIALWILLAGLFPAPAFSQDMAINTQSFKPSPFMNDLYEVEQAEMMADWYRWNGGLYLNYQNDPLILKNNNSGVVRKVVAHQLTADVLLAFKLTDWINIGMAIPVHLYKKGEGFTANDMPEKFSFGDVRLHTKFRVFRSASERLTLAIAPVVGFPVGKSTDSFSGAEGMTFLPRVLLDVSFNRVDLSINGGYRFNDNVKGGGIEISDELNLAVGGLFRILPEKLSAIAELTASAKAKDPFSAMAETPIEARGGVRWFAKKWLHFNLGAGMGLTAGYGIPDYRIFAGAKAAMPEEKPVCTAAQPPIEEAPADTDNDSILDDVDQCPNEPEDIDAFEDDDGCPDDDNDGDGIPDDKDKCPAKAEDHDGFEDDDGCPDDDNDGDGIPDNKDECALEVEDVDGFEDTDGCPDPDNDGDGIADNVDKCPNEAEVVNGEKDDDGCPDEALKVEKGAKIDLAGKIYFVYDKPEIQATSFGVLDNVVLTLKNHPEILKLRIEGHTDTHGGNWHNELLSKERAKAVRNYLIEKGIEKERLQTWGYGETRPLVKDEKSEEDKERNRRVEFVIVEIAP